MAVSPDNCKHEPHKWVTPPNRSASETECTGCDRLLRDVLVPRNGVLKWLDEGGVLAISGDEEDEEAALEAKMEEIADGIAQNLWS